MTISSKPCAWCTKQVQSLNLKGLVVPSAKHPSVFRTPANLIRGEREMRRKGKQKWTWLRAGDVLVLCFGFLLLPHPEQNHYSIWCWIRYQLPKEPEAPELVCLLLRMLQTLFLSGWGRKWQRYFLKAVEAPEFCVWDSSVTSLAGEFVPSLLGVRSSQLFGVCAAAGAQSQTHTHITGGPDGHTMDTHSKHQQKPPWAISKLHF